MSRSSRRNRSLALVLVGAISAGVLPRPALAEGASTADKAAAADYMREGKDLRTAGDHDGALKKFRAAYALVPSPVTGLAVAQEETALGLLLEARESLSAIARMPVSATETAFSAKAREDAATLQTELTARIPVIEIKVTNVPTGQVATIAVDGKPVAKEAADAGWRVNPGAHTVVARVAGQPDQSYTLELKERERKPVELVFPIEEPPPKPVDPPVVVEQPRVVVEPTAAVVTPPPPTIDGAPRDTTLRTVGLVALGSGIVVAGIGGIVGLAAKSSYSSAKTDHCPGGTCDLQGKQLTDDARGRAGTATIVVGVGALLAIGGTVLWLAAPSDEPKVGVTNVGLGLGSLTIGGRF
jgi:hypothetical protein